MSQDFTRENRSLAEKIRACESAADIQNLLAETPITTVLNGAAPEPVAPFTVGRRLSATAVTPDGRTVTVHADGFMGLDCLLRGVRAGRITEDI
jgi:hypothetical protein